MENIEGDLSLEFELALCDIDYQQARYKDLLLRYEDTGNPKPYSIAFKHITISGRPRVSL